MTLRQFRHALFRLGIAAAAGWAFGCFGLVAGLLPIFVFEKVTGIAAHPSVFTLMAGTGAIAGGVWGARSFWRDIGPEPRPAVSRRPRFSWRVWRNSIPALARPPWEEPRFIDWLGPDAALQPGLRARLDPVIPDARCRADTEAGIFRDRYTGQLWRSEYCEQGFGSGHALVPIDTDATTAQAGLAKRDEKLIK